MSFERNRLITIPPDAPPFNNTRSTQYYHDTTIFSIVLSQYNRSSTIYLRHHLTPNCLITPPDNHHLIMTAPGPPPFNYTTRHTRFKHDTIRPPTVWTQHQINTIKTWFHHIPHRLITILRDPTSLSPYHHTLHPLITTWPDTHHSITISPNPFTVSSRSYELSHRFISLILCTKLWNTLIMQSC